jgi:hypothetical protein
LAALVFISGSPRIGYAIVLPDLALWNNDRQLAVHTTITVLRYLPFLFLFFVLTLADAARKMAFRTRYEHHLDSLQNILNPISLTA